MSDIIAYCSQVEQLLETKRATLDATSLKTLRDSFSAYQIYFENIFNILLRKGLIQEDPYKYDEKITEVNTPSDDALLESEESEKISQRLSSYHSNIEFMNNYYEFSLGFITLSRIKRIVKFAKYINWSQVTETSTSLMTRTLAKYFGKIRHGSDPLSASIINDSIVQIEKTLKQAFSTLGEITAFQKEQYKLELRQRIFSRLNLQQYVPEEKVEDIIKKVKSLFGEAMGKNVSFFPDMVKEVIREDLMPGGEELRHHALESLKIQEVRKKEEKKEDIYKSILIQAVRFLASCNLQLEDALNKVLEAQQLFESQEMTFGRRLRKWLVKLISRQEEKTLYEIEYFDVGTSANHNEKVDILEFIDETKRAIQLFSGLSSKGSQVFHKLEVSPEDKIFQLLNGNLIQLQIIYRRLNGLIVFFKTEIPKDKRGKVRGIKLELNSIKNSIVKANQKKHEYVSIKEEEEQMKRLGLKKEIS
ncbi:MAG: hypothetical protein JW904_02815 [Spirochaetales bacterium]|nr:hypothetical protein [Spirochaetales bacterium]